MADKRESMRDIRGDLQDRVDMFEQQVSLENARFEQLILRLRRNTTTSLNI